MAPAPPAELKNREEIVFDSLVLPSPNDDEDDNTGPQYEYYKSDKILGKLYRAVDEQRIWKDNINSRVAQSEDLVWGKLREHIYAECEQFQVVDWDSAFGAAMGEARGIYQAYVVVPCVDGLVRLS